MKSAWKRLAGTVVTVGLAVCVGAGYAALTGNEATDWAKDGGNVTFDTAQGYITASFEEYSTTQPPRHVPGGVLADVGVASGSFVGDYIAARIEGLSFRVKRGGSGVTSVKLYLKGATGRIWSNTKLVLSETPGDWAISNVSFDRGEGGWTRGERANLDALWDIDLRNVQEVGFFLCQAGSTGQSCSIDDFRLIGDGFVSEEAILAELRQHFDVNISNVDQLTGAQLAQDSDKDSRSDANAIVAGDDPGLAAEILEVAVDGITIRWPCVKGKTYTVVRTSDLADGFSLAVLTDEEAQENGWMAYKDTGATAPDPYFYKVIKK